MFRLHKHRGTVQFTKFSLIGIINGTVDLVALNLLLWAWPYRQAVDLLLINSVAYGLAVLNSYFWNSRYTFRQHAFFSRREKLYFVLQAIISLLISNGIFLLFALIFRQLPVPKWIAHNAAKGLSMACSSTSSFFFMKYWVFTRNSMENKP